MLIFFGFAKLGKINDGNIKLGINMSYALLTTSSSSSCACKNMFAIAKNYVNSLCANQFIYLNCVPSHYHIFPVAADGNMFVK